MEGCFFEGMGDENPEKELTVDALYGTRDPKNQALTEDDMAFKVRRVDKEEDIVEVKYLGVKPRRIIPTVYFN